MVIPQKMMLLQQLANLSTYIPRTWLKLAIKSECKYLAVTNKSFSTTIITVTNSL